MNNRITKLNNIILTIIILVLTGCQSTSQPDWYTEPKLDTSDYIYAVGEGRNLSHAKKVAANQINERLWTQVSSSFEFRETSFDRNNQNTYQSFTDNKINTKTATITLNGIEYLQQSKNDIAYYVEARIKKSTIRKQLKEELRQLNLSASQQLNALNKTDTLLWWLRNKNVADIKKSALTRVAMLSAIDENSIYNTDKISALQAKVNEVKNKILIVIKADYSDKKLAMLLSEKFAAKQIATSLKSNRLATHTLKLETERRKNKVGDAYITTLITDVTVSNKNKKTIANSEIISSGNSVTNYKMSSEGAMRHFAEQVENKNLWEAIGF